MRDFLLSLFEQHSQLAIFISLSISILIAVSGVLPSFFITAANILFFGFWQGTLISFLGEALGAAIAFLLYRKGFKKMAENKIQNMPSLQHLMNAKGIKAFNLVFSLRLLPFVPSGLITFAAAVGSIQFSSFLLASSLGKIPALLLEAYSVNEVTKFSWQGKLILLGVSTVLVFFAIKKLAATRKTKN